MPTGVEKSDDYYAWTRHRSESLRRLGLQDVAEELEEMGRNEEQRLKSHLRSLIAHKMKLQHNSREHPAVRQWNNTVKNEIDQIKDLMQDNPSLMAKADLLTAKAHKLACRDVNSELDIPLKTLQETVWSFSELTGLSKKRKK